MKKITEIFYSSIFLILISQTASGVETFEHSTCKVHMHPFKHEYKYDKALVSKLEKKLKIKGYELVELKDDKKLEPSEFHVTLKRTLYGNLYKECLIEVLIQRSRTNTAKSSDPIFYKIEKSRRFPRQTLKGKERCLLALEDTFFALNICKTK